MLQAMHYPLANQHHAGMALSLPAMAYKQPHYPVALNDHTYCSDVLDHSFQHLPMGTAGANIPYAFPHFSGSALSSMQYPGVHGTGVGSVRVEGDNYCGHHMGIPRNSRRAGTSAEGPNAGDLANSKAVSKHIMIGSDGIARMVTVDPLTRKLHIPCEFVFPTRASQRGTLPSLCQLFLNGRCRLGSNCYQVHADVHVVAQLRAQVDSLPRCCAFHGDKDHVHSLHHPLRDRLFVKLPGSTWGGDGNIPLHRLSFTTALRWLLGENKDVIAALHQGLPKLPRDIDSEGFNVTAVVDSPTGNGRGNSIVLAAGESIAVCRLHIADRCRYAEDCKFLHICKEVVQKDPHVLLRDESEAFAMPTSWPQWGAPPSLAGESGSALDVSAVAKREAGGTHTSMLRPSAAVAPTNNTQGNHSASLGSQVKSGSSCPVMPQSPLPPKPRLLRPDSSASLSESIQSDGATMTVTPEAVAKPISTQTVGVPAAHLCAADISVPGSAGEKVLTDLEPSSSPGAAMSKGGISASHCSSTHSNSSGDEPFHPTLRIGVPVRLPTLDAEKPQPLLPIPTSQPYLKAECLGCTSRRYDGRSSRWHHNPYGMHALPVTL